jgi:putative membrane protein insertion efficiency factor
MVAQVLLVLIRVYQLTLSRLIRLTLGNVCRFEPSCSRYAAACLTSHGALRGSLLSVKRLCRCHPFHPGGYDPPPPPRDPARQRSGLLEGAAAGALKSEGVAQQEPAGPHEPNEPNERLCPERPAGAALPEGLHGTR